VSDAVCEPGTAFAAEVAAVRRGDRTAEGATAALVGRLRDDELLWLLDGDLPIVRGSLEMARGYNAVPFEGGRLDRLGIPGIRLTDGPRGVVVGASTGFPAAIARAASFDVDLERRVGDAIGREGRAQGANLFSGICVNVAPFPGWGRSQEAYGEDPLLTGAMGAALTRGVRPWLLACVKHFALNSMEEARFTVDAEADDRLLHEVYLPHFRAVVEAGADAVMSAYNSVNGTWAGDSRHLLTGILRDAWGFTGLVLTDFVFGLRHPVESVAAGQDLEMPFRQQRAATLPAALRTGRLARADAERCAARLVGAQLRLALRAEPTPPPGVVACPDHRRLAREAAARGIVLLRNEQVTVAPALPQTDNEQVTVAQALPHTDNEQVTQAPALPRTGPEPRAQGVRVAALPLIESELRRVVVVGRLAGEGNLGDNGSSRVRAPAVCSVLDGLRERLGDRVVHVAAGGPGEAAAGVRGADVAVVVVGLGPADEGEAMVGIDTDAARLYGGPARWRPAAAALARAVNLGARMKGITGGDRRDLHLRAEDVAVVRAVAGAHPRTVVVVVGGGTIMPDPWDREVAAVLLVWYPGMEGGRAVADVLLGDAEPGGRLPFAIPRRREDLPVVDWRARLVRYPRWFGQRRLDRDGVPAAYPFGFGLGYTTFRIDTVHAVRVDAERFDVTVTVTNTGERAGRHVVQVYATQTAHPDLPARALAGFRPVACEAGRTASVTIECSLRPLQVWTGNGFEPGVTGFGVEAASHAGDPAAVRCQS
jgi:beta-glucosidase